MTALLRAERIRLSTVPAPLVAVMAVLALSATVIGIGFATAPPDAAKDLGELVRVPGVLAGLTMLVLGVLGGSSDFQHRTAEPTYLIRPRRLEVFAARQATYAVFGAVAGALTGTLAWLLAGIVGSTRDLPAGLIPDPLGLIAAFSVAAMLAAVLGVSIGYAARSTVPGIIGVVVWSAVGENLLGLVVPKTYLPVGSISGVVGLGDSGSALHAGLGLAVYAALTAAVTVRLTLPRDIT
jgi:ABC-2 type transport system permease protein